jgi:hypothetical protein
MNIASGKSPVIEWGVQQAMRIFGVRTLHEALQAAHSYQTDDVSSRVTQDVLLLAGAEDHYVPLDELWTQSRSLTHVRSLTKRYLPGKRTFKHIAKEGTYPSQSTLYVSGLM